MQMAAPSVEKQPPTPGFQTQPHARPTIVAPQLTDFTAASDWTEIPYRFIFNNKRKLKMIKGGCTFEEVKESVQETFPEIAKVKFPINNLVLQYETDGTLNFIEDEAEWSEFQSSGACQSLKENRQPLKIVNKKTRKRARATPAGATPSGPATKRPAIGQGPRPKTMKPVRDIKESMAYKKANFRGALQEHFQRCPDGKDVKLVFATTEREKGAPPHKRCYISTCKLVYKEQEINGMGHAPAKKASIQFAALDVILKLGLVTAEEHQEIHPPASVEDKTA